MKITFQINIEKNDEYRLPLYSTFYFEQYLINFVEVFATIVSPSRAIWLLRNQITRCLQEYIIVDLCGVWQTKCHPPENHCLPRPKVAVHNVFLRVTCGLPHTTQVNIYFLAIKALLFRSCIHKQMLVGWLVSDHDVIHISGELQIL